MTYQVLARKLRPQKFQEVIGQLHIIRSLQNSIIRQKPGHAYLFAGTRGVGKTTIARIFAKALRCDSPNTDGNSCNQCNSCLDFDTENSMNVMEIDGASNNSVDNIRDLVSNVQYLPTTGKYKIYIIDEVHMLSTSAFNALLKTLEEPPAHVIFLFATTAPGKLLPTVLSRCQRFDLKNISTNDLEDFLKDVAKKEHIEFESSQIIREICVQGNGSVRDMLSLLDQVVSYSENNYIDENILVTSLGIARRESVNSIGKSILRGDVRGLAGTYRKLLGENVSVENIIISILNFFYETIEKIDTSEELAGIDPQLPDIMGDISTAEIFWIYESLARDSIWVVESIASDKSSEILLKKLALRRSFFKKKFNFSVDRHEEYEKKKIETDESDCNIEKKSIVNNDVIEEKKQEKTWEGFIEYLYSISPASASNLEQGNIISPLRFERDQIHIELGFCQSEKVFFDYLNEPDIFKKLGENIAGYFNNDYSNINLNLRLVDDLQKKESNFQSRVEILHEKEEEEEMNQKKKFCAHDMILEAESLFNSKIDLIKINRK
ncbi:MAG: DNA polymerase III subunit gamma/tau [Bacteriovoracaceae bacterium]|nr:DNA polymerase III subunit gamma/tau [Bacteriovoracaceae bacterium]